MPLKRYRNLCGVTACAVVLSVLVGCTKAFPDKTQSFREFSLDEFYDIKKSIQNRKARLSSKALTAEKQKMESLKLQAPRGPAFYGQDHYQRSFDDRGKETWTHVGRPVRRSTLNW